MALSHMQTLQLRGLIAQLRSLDPSKFDEWASSEAEAAHILGGLPDHCWERFDAVANPATMRLIDVTPRGLDVPHTPKVDPPPTVQERLERTRAFLERLVVEQ